MSNKNGIIDWVRASYCENKLESGVNKYYCDAVIAGHEKDHALWVIRARHEGHLIPGKLVLIRDTAFAYIPFDREEVRVYDFEIMVAPPHLYNWVNASNGVVPLVAIPAGYNESGEPTFVGRVRHQSSVTPGKVNTSSGCCYISFRGKVYSYKHYEILCKAN